MPVEFEEKNILKSGFPQKMSANLVQSFDQLYQYYEKSKKIFSDSDGANQ